MFYPLFKLYGPDAQVREIYLDGRLKGFPPDMYVINHAKDILFALALQISRLSGSGELVEDW